MPRFSDDELTRLKAVPLLDLCRDYGIELRAAGKDWKGRCPFHEDDSPSFVVSPGKNLWNCLGHCGSGGDTIALVMKHEGVSFRHACEKLRARLGAAPPPAILTTRVGTAHDILCTPAEAAEDATLLGTVAEFYHRTFCNEPAAMKYLQARACFHPEAVTTFRLGYANRTLGYRVPPQETLAGRELKARLQTLGVLRAETGHEHLNGCVVFPIHDAGGPSTSSGERRIVQLYGRKLAVKLPPDAPRHLYLAGPQRGVWNAAGLSPGADWFLGEALIDALTLWAHGWRSVTASYGVNGFTAEHAALVAERRPGRVVLCYDADTAGHAKAAALAHELAATGVAVWRAALPEGKDVNDVAREADDPATALRAVIDGAKKIAGPVVVAAPSARPELVEGLPQSSCGELVESADAIAPASSSLAACPDKVGAEAAKEEASSALAVVKHDADEIVLACEGRTYRVRGLAKNTGFESLKISLRIACGDSWHLDTLDLAQAKQRAAFVAAAADETGLKPDALKRDVGRVLMKLEELQEQRLRAQVAPESAAVKMSEAERTEALALLRDPKLLDRILTDFAACGVVGEEMNKLVGYLATVSRKLDAPLAVIVQSTSAAGKSALMDAVLAFVPPEERVKYSALTGQALFYLSETNLKHKILAIVEEEGAERASYALKLLQSEGELTIAATGKDPHTGRMTTQEYRVEGPVMIFLTTTAVDIDEELLNRCLILTVDEGRAQTAAIHRTQRERETLDGLLRAESRTAVLAVQRNAQRLLRSLRVVNPYAEQLTFLDDRTRTRRDHTKYLALIRTIALLHQHQRPIRTVERNGVAVEYIEATLDDIAAANRLAHDVLGRSLDDMPPQTRRLLALLETMVAEQCAARKVARDRVLFSRRQVREVTSWGDTQLRVHLERLAQLEYLVPHRGSVGQTFVYELAYDGGGKDGRRFLPGLFDVAQLHGANLAGVNGDLAGGLRGQNGPFAAGSRGGENRDASSENRAPEPKPRGNAHQDGASAAA